MSSSYCWRCVSRTSTASARPFLLSPSSSTAPVRTSTASFHTTASRYAQPAKRKGQHSGPSFREARASRVKSKGAPAKAKRLTPDERRALGRRIVLSNANALEVSGMQDMTATNVTEPGRVGQVMGLPMPLVEKLREQQTFKPTQNWNLFRRPATLIREETVEMAKLIAQISKKEGASSKTAAAMVVDGARGTGKSIHLTQAITLGLLNDWIVVSMPDAEDLVDARTAYAPLPGSNPVQYIQPDATSELLQRMIAGNSHILTKLHLSQPLPNIKNLAPNASLLELATIGAQRRDVAWPAFKALWAELTATAPSPKAEGIKPFATRPPMLVTADCFSHWMRQSKYLNSDFKPIHAHDFCLVDHFISLGQRDLTSALPNGGLVLYATSKSSVPNLVSLDTGVKQIAARAAGIKPSSPEFPNGNPYDKADYRVAAYFKDAKSFGFTELAGLPKKDVKGLLDYYARSGVLREKIDEHAVGEKWTLSGGGVIGELEQLGRRLRALPLTEAIPEAPAGAVPELRG